MFKNNAWLQGIFQEVQGYIKEVKTESQANGLKSDFLDIDSKVLDYSGEREVLRKNIENPDSYGSQFSEKFLEETFKVSTLNEGNYYLSNGFLIKQDLSKNDVYIVIPFAGNNLFYPNEWDFKQGYFWKKLDISHNYLKKFAGLIYNETRGVDFKEALCVANSVDNYAKYTQKYSESNDTKKDIIESIIYFKRPMFYTLDPMPLEPSQKDINIRCCFASVINIFTQSIDFSNESTHWDGADLLQRGIDHPKIIGQGVDIDENMWEYFKKSYIDSNGVGRKNFGNITIKDISEKKIKAIDSLNKGKILFKSACQFGGHLFWKPNFQAEENQGYNWKYLFFSTIFGLFFLFGCNIYDKSQVNKSNKKFEKIIDFIEHKNEKKFEGAYKIDDVNYVLKVGHIFTTKNKHLIIYEPTQRLDSMFLYILSNKNNKWSVIYTNEISRYIPSPPNAQDILICNDRNEHEFDLKVINLVNLIQNCTTYHYFIYQNKTDNFIHIPHFSKIYSPKKDKKTNKIYGCLNIGCADFIKEYSCWEWENNDIKLKNMTQINCCKFDNNSIDSCSIKEFYYAKDTIIKQYKTINSNTLNITKSYEK